MLKVKQPRHQPRRRGRAAGGRREEPGPLPLEHLPVDQGSQFRQFMVQVDQIDQMWTEEIILFRWANVMFHRQTKIAGFLKKSHKALQEMARITATIQNIRVDNSPEYIARKLAIWLRGGESPSSPARFSGRTIAIAIDEDNATQHMPVNDSRLAVAHGEERLKPDHLRIRQPE